MGLRDKNAVSPYVSRTFAVAESLDLAGNILDGC